MGQTRNYGRAYKIRQADVRSYESTSAPRGYRPNPIGVTSLMRVNRRSVGGAPRTTSRSAKDAARGKTAAERLQIARSLMKGKSMRTNAGRGHRAKFVSKMKSNPGGARRRAQRAAAYKGALRRGMKANSARSSALRKVPFTATERRSGARFAGTKARLRRNPGTVAMGEGIPMSAIGGDSDTAKTVRMRKPRTTKQRAATKKMQAAAARKRRAKGGKKTAKRTTKKGARKTRKTRKGRKARKARKSRQYKTVATTRRRKVTKVMSVKGKRRVRVRYGKYKRVVMTNPRTGKREYSYMYRGKGGRLRRIPTKTIVGKSEKMATRVRKGRIRAARRLVKYGDPFTMNRNGKKRKARKSTKSSGATAARKRAARRRKAFLAALAKGYSRTKAVRSALRKVPLRGNDVFANRAATKKRKTRKTAKRKTRKGTRKGRKRQTKKQRAASLRNLRKARKSRKAKGRKTTKRRRKSSKGRKVTRRRAKSRKGRKTTRRARKSTRRAKGRKGTRKMKRNGRRRSRRSYRRNSIGALFITVMKAGALITAGFLTHRLLTNLAITYLVPLLKPAAAAPAAVTGWDYATFEKPLVGAVVLAVGLPLTNVVAKGMVVQIGAGMFASFATSLVMSVVSALDTTGKVAPQLSGYPNSRAWDLRGRRGGYAGLGARNAGGILPRYAPVGQFRQAAAGTGTYRQAAAGTGFLGEYFSSNGVGEYFAPAGIQGVGDYEPAGPLALQSSVPQSIDDGIRPDANIDGVMDLMESAAGVNGTRRRGVRGMGEYITAAQANGQWNEATVPTSSQWIPNGPMWAGTLGVKDTQIEADLPAGTLAGPGGNGTLSG
jgi:hypothetical protein